MKYTVALTSRARRDLYGFRDPTLQRLAEAIAGLADNPRPPGCKKLRAK